MSYYIYKGFKLTYQVKENKGPQAFYSAEGNVESSDMLPQRFHTSYASRNEVIDEIKKLMENYIDFEWKEFQAMKVEKITNK